MTSLLDSLYLDNGWSRGYINQRLLRKYNDSILVVMQDDQAARSSVLTDSVWYQVNDLIYRRDFRYLYDECRNELSILDYGTWEQVS